MFTVSLSLDCAQGIFIQCGYLLYSDVPLPSLLLLPSSRNDVKLGFIGGELYGAVRPFDSTWLLVPEEPSEDSPGCLRLEIELVKRGDARAGALGCWWPSLAPLHSSTRPEQGTSPRFAQPRSSQQISVE